MIRLIWMVRRLCRLSADPAIGALIAQRGVVKYRPGMDTVDYQVLNKVGQRRWVETVQGQRRIYKPDQAPTPVLRFEQKTGRT